MFRPVLKAVHSSSNIGIIVPVHETRRGLSAFDLVLEDTGVLYLSKSAKIRLLRVGIRYHDMISL